MLGWGGLCAFLTCLRDTISVFFVCMCVQVCSHVHLCINMYFACVPLLYFFFRPVTAGMLFYVVGLLFIVIVGKLDRPCICFLATSNRFCNKLCALLIMPFSILMFLRCKLQENFVKSAFLSKLSQLFAATSEERCFVICSVS